MHLFPHSLQLTHNLIICELSHISFHIHCNRIAILSFSNLKIVRCPVIHSTFIAIDLTSDHLWIFKLCVFLHLFPHSLQSTCHSIIFWFWNCALFCISFHIDCNRLAILSFSNLEIVRYPTSLSTFIAIDLPSDHLWILFRYVAKPTGESLMAFANCRQRTQHHSQASSLLNGSQSVS